MSEPSREDVLDKLDALLKRHQPAADADIPVLTDIVAPPDIDLEAIPLLTEEISPPAEPAAPVQAEPLPPLPELEPLDFELPEEAAVIVVPEAAAQAPGETPPPAEARAAPSVLEFDIPPGARYVALAGIVDEAAATPETGLPSPLLGHEAPAAAEPPRPDATTPLASAPVHVLSDETVRAIADTVRDDVAKILETQLQQVLARQFQSGLHLALDRALSSMLDQFVIHIEEVVKVSIANELKKQLAELPRPDSH
jgi:hypothetical protein